MADASFLQDDEDNDDRHDALVPISPHDHHLDGFNVYPAPAAIDFTSSQDFFYGSTRCFDPNIPPISSRDRETQVNFVIDMFHQRVEQSQSQWRSASRVVEESRLVPSDRSFGGVEGNYDANSNEFEIDFGLGLGFRVENHDNPNEDDDDYDDNNSGSMIANPADDCIISQSSSDRHGAPSESHDSFNGSGVPDLYIGEIRVTGTGLYSDLVNMARRTTIVEVEDDSRINGGCDDLRWDAFQLEDDNNISTNPNPNPNPNPNQNPNSNPNQNPDFDWEEVDDRIDEREIMSMFFGAEADDDASVLPGNSTNDEESVENRDALEWEVLLNANNFEPDPDLEDQYDDYNYTELFFGQFADSDVSSLGRPPASKSAIENLSTIIITRQDFEKNNTLCAVCKDELSIGEMSKKLPCNHRYHGECIVPWLGIRNTCPVCRHELPTDDPDYERGKAERVARGH